MSETEVDVIVIGSGPGGGACAWSLARQGIKVCILEAGPAYDYLQDYQLHRSDWELIKFPDKIKTAGRQSYADMQELDERRSDLFSWNHIRGRFNQSKQRKTHGYHHVVGVGGSSLHFAGEAHRLNPASMNMKTRFDVAADWPFTYSELEPYYNVAEQVVGVAGNNDEPVRWRSKPFPLPAHEFNYGSQKIVESGSALGLNWQANSLAVLSRPYQGRPSCNHCNHCSYGCPRADKGSVDVTFIRQALASGHCQLKTNARVTQVIAAEGDVVSSVQYLDKNNELHSLNARVVVIACGAVETPRLLLNSASNMAEDGLANESGLVGKNFMETLFWTSSGLHSEPLGSHRGVPSDVICWDFNAPDAIDNVIGGCRFSSSVSESALVGPVNYAKRVVPGWGLEHKQQMRELFGKVLSVGAIGESLPNKNSFIDLATDEHDDDGLPKAHIHSYLGDMELDRLAFMAKSCRSILEASGVGQIFEEYGSYDSFSATHVFGTCRMGKEAEKSVVNEFGQSHRWKNLFITDASVFPSSGGGEAPSLSIEALAIRSADYIAKQAKKQEL